MSAILDGRPTAPTPAERAAHPGRWRARHPDGRVYTAREPDAEVLAWPGATWWALDAGTELPGAWPTTEGG